MTVDAPDLLEEPSLRQVLGRPVLRSEDRALLTGTAQYLDDVPCEGALHGVFVRSPLAHALVQSVVSVFGSTRDTVMSVVAL